MVTVTKSTGFYDVGTDGYNWSDEDLGIDISSLTDWTLSTPDTSYISVLEEIQGHAKVVAITHTGGAAPKITLDIAANDRDAVECYLRMNSLAGDGFIEIGGSVTSQTARLFLDDGDIAYTDNTGNHDTGDDWEASKWYHCGIAWRITGAAAFAPWGTALAEGEFSIKVGDTVYGPYTLKSDEDITYIEFYSLGYSLYVDAIAFESDGDYTLGDNEDLLVATSISNDLIYEMKIHHPTTLEKARVRFGDNNYTEYFPIMVCRIDYSETITLGSIIQVTDNHTSAGATASEVIFKGEVVKKITSKMKSFQPLYLVYSNAKEMNYIKPNASYTKDTDGFISDVLTNLCDKLTEGTLVDGADLGTFSAVGDKSFEYYIRQCAKLDGYISYIDPANGADNADLMYDAGDTDTGVNIDESTAYLQALISVESIDEHINQVYVRGGISSDGTRAVGSASDTTSQGLYGVIPTYDSDSTLNTDALCNTKADQILADNEYGNKKVTLLYRYSTEGMLQPGETVTFDWDSSVKNIGYDIEQEQYIIALNVYDVKTSQNRLTLYSSIYYGKQSDADVLQETSHLALLNSENIETNAGEIDLENYLEWNDADNNGWEIDHGDTTEDSAWHELDLDSYVTVHSGAIGAVFRVSMSDSNGSIVYGLFRSTTQSNGYQVACGLSQGASAAPFRLDLECMIPLDSDNKFDYYFVNTVTSLGMIVNWWIIGH